MKKSTIVTILALAFFLCKDTHAQISGTVFRDYNHNGTRQTSSTAGLLNETLQAGVTVKATLANGNVVTKTTTSASAPNFSFSAAEVGSSGAVRIEFIAADSFDKPTARAASGTAYNGTNVQFVTAGAATTNVNYALSNPGDYFKPNPLTVTPFYANGASQDVSNSSKPGLLGMLYDGSGTFSTIATVAQVGAIWGVAYKPNTKTIYAAAVLRRHAGFGTGADNTINTADDIAAIYVMNNYGGSGAAAISAVINMNSFAGVNVGANPRLGTSPANDLGATGSANHDFGVYGNEGKTGIGDIEVSEDGNTLYVLNLNNKQLVLLNVTNPTNPALTGIYTIPTPPGAPAGDNYRPWAIGVNNGKVYVGGVMAADVSQDVNSLRAYVQEFTGSGFTTVDIDAATANDFINLNYNRTTRYCLSTNSATYTPGEWRPWSDNASVLFSGATSGTGTANPQPILADIDFDENGSLILGLMDRNSMQAGFRIIRQTVQITLFILFLVVAT